MAKLRQEMQAGDQQVATRLDSTNQAVAAQNARIDALEQELQAFRSEYTVSIEKVRGMLKFNVPVHFEYDSAELREADRPVLDRFASVVTEYYPGALVTVEGFTDPSGERRLQPAAWQAARAGGVRVPRHRRVDSRPIISRR